MKRTMNFKTEWGGYKQSYETPYVVLNQVVGEQYFEAKLYGLCRYMPSDFALAMFGTFKKDDRHVLYTADVVYEDGELIHNPVSEMMDDIAYLISGHAEILD